MKGFLDLHLRVLYSFNSDSQLILAKSYSPTPVIPLDSKGGTNSPKYATVAFKTCLQTLTKCSPEILSHGTDYSIYVHDPLESGSEPVAVGMGLLSQGLYSTESHNATITGTIVKCHNDIQSLEVRMALRTMILPRPQDVSQAQVHHQNPQVITSTSVPIKEAPSARARPGRRKGSKKAQTQVHVIDVDATPAKTPNTRSSKGKGRQTATTSPSAPSTTVQPSAPSNLFDLISAIANTQAPSEMQNAALIAALSQIDASSSKDGSTTNNSDFLTAITQMLSGTNGSTPLPVNDLPTPEITRRHSHDEGSKPVDKENVSPKLVIRIKPPAKSIPSTSSPPNSTLPTPSSSQLVPPGDPTPLRQAIPSTPPSVLRKRTTRDDVLCNSPRRKENANGSSSRTFLVPGRVINDRSLATSSPPTVAQSSPPRRANSSQSIFDRVPASSPIRNPIIPRRKKFVLPDWARTDTTTKPRYREDVAEALKSEEEKAQFKKDEKYRLRRQRDKERQSVGRRTISTNPRASSLAATTAGASSSSVTLDSSPLELPITAAPGPVLAALPQQLATQSKSISPPPTRRFAEPPQTPPRKRRSISTPGETPLFTPTPSNFSLRHSCESPHSPTRSPARKKARWSDTRTPPPGAPLLVPEAVDEDDNEDWLASEFDNHQVGGPSTSQSEAPSDSDDPFQVGPSTSATSDFDLTEGSVSPLPTKEYWPGLPPSSPMQPSSPMIPDSDFPMDGGDSDAEAEPFALSQSTDTDSLPSTTEYSAQMQQFDLLLQMGGTHNPFESYNFDPTFAGENMDFDLLPQQIDGDEIPVYSSDMPDFEAALETGLPALPLPEFWSSVQPFGTGDDINTQGQATSSTEPIPFGADNTSFEAHLHSLFSGCVM